LSKYDWNTRSQKVLNKYFSVNRSKNKTTFLLIPYFTDLTPYFRKYRCKIWIHIYAKGKGVIFKRTRKETSDDPWDLKTDEKIFDSKTKGLYNSEVGDELLLEIYRSYKKYWREFEFDDLSSHEKKIYKEFKEKYQSVGLEEDDKVSVTARRHYNQLKIAVDLLYHRFKLTQQEIADALGYKTKEGISLLLRSNIVSNPVIVNNNTSQTDNFQNNIEGSQ
jgi:hypothetical protein